jgi:hypothetical protein
MTDRLRATRIIRVCTGRADTSLRCPTALFWGRRRCQAGRHDQYNVQTVGGLVWAELCRRPEVGDEVTIGNVTFRVEAIEGLTVTQVSLFFPAGTG